MLFSIKKVTVFAAEKINLKERLSTTNIEDVKKDVRPFLRNDPHQLDIWSNDYFLQLADRIVWL